MAANHKSPELIESGIDFYNKESVLNKLKQYEGIISDKKCCLAWDRISDVVS